MKNLYFVCLSLILLATGFALYGHHAVIRYPALTIDPALSTPHYQKAETLRITANGAYLKSKQTVQFRAYQPQVKLQINTLETNDAIKLYIENIHPDAKLQTQGIKVGQVEETITGLIRKIEITGIAPGKEISIQFEFPRKNRYRFVSIGDTGGDRELSWGLKRGAELGADFILHMGDIYYDVSEQKQISKRLNNSPVPVYAANGNHDFQGPDGNVIELFLRDVGPLNARFSLLGHCFINLDTGAFMYPPGKGARAAMLAAEIVNHRRQPERCSDYIVYTHKPMVLNFEADFPQQDHSLYSWHARPLIEQLQQLDNVTLIAGHIHNDFEFEQDGIKTYVTGSGLAHRDLLSGKKNAKVLLGEIRAGHAATFDWAYNEMPLEYHCSKRLYQGLLKAGNPLADTFENTCNRETQ